MSDDKCRDCLDTGTVIANGEFTLCRCHEPGELKGIRDGLAIGMRLALDENAQLKSRIAALEAELADVRTLRDYAAKEAHKTLGTAIQLCVSGNGEAWRVFVGELSLSPQSCENSFETAIKLGAAWVREKGGGK